MCVSADTTGVCVLHPVLISHSWFFSLPFNVSSLSRTVVVALAHGGKRGCIRANVSVALAAVVAQAKGAL